MGAIRLDQGPEPMVATKTAVFRFYVIATLIVVVLGSIVFALRRPAPDLRIAAPVAGGTPTVEQRVPEVPVTPRPFTGQGPWVLSALPLCFDEQSRIRGPLADLRKKLPPAADRIAPGTTIHAGDCTVRVRPHDLLVDRGADRLRVPPESALYRVAGRLTLVARSGGKVEIRRY
jgi:hypothetical protein